MTEFLQKLISRNDIAQILLRAGALALAVLATAALPERASAQASATFTSSKILCLGSPSATNPPSTCQPAQDVPYGAPVFYVITVTNPAGQPPQVITINETSPGFPSGFSPNPGAPSCNDQTGGSVSVATNGQIYTFNLAPAVTTPSWTVTCTISGTFLPSANGTTQTNSAIVSNGHGGFSQTDTVNTFVDATTPLPTDLSVTKSGPTTPVDVSAGPATISYTITVKNNTSTPVDVGHWFVLHDVLALLPYSVALQASFVNATCTSTAHTDCLDPAGPSAPFSGLITTAGPQALFGWGYATNSQGHFDGFGSFTVTVIVRVSAISGLTCIKAPNSDGLRNQAFFTLTNLTDHTAAYDLNPVDDTSAWVPVSVITGNSNANIDPNCGDAQLTFTKTQHSPPNPVSWIPPPATVTYDITIKNTSVPAQAITINAGDLKDHVVEGPGTPPFKRTFVSATCTSIPATVCAGFAGAPQPFHNYTYYGESNLGWGSASQLVLNPGDTVTIRITFQYTDPDCETVPNTNPKPIINVASVTYMATPVGGSGPPVQFTQYAKAQTNMTPQPPCKFVVTKTLTSGGPNVQFGNTLYYTVTFTNNGNARNVGTVMDSVRINTPAYATQVPFTANWACGSTSTPPVTGFTPSGPPASGQAIYTSLPPQGAPIFQFTNVNFPQNSTLTCTVKITVQHPAVNNPNCSTLPAYFENLALMDVTTPYNPNVAWPPSSTYVVGTSATWSNPPPQTTNWATVDSLLPKCYNVVINKTASVNGVTPAWTSPSGPAVQYGITVTNTGTSGILPGGVPSLPPPLWNGLRVEDVITPPPYNNNLINPFGCTPGCVSLSPPAPPPHSPSYAGIQNLGPGASAVWSLTLNPPFIVGQTINNCATVTPQGTFVTGQDWYANYDLNNPPTNPPTACAHVPVLTTAALGVIKKVVNETGHTITIPASQFGVHVVCTPWPLQPPPASPGNLTLTVGPATLPNGGSASSLTGLVHNVPIADTCTVTEPTLAAMPLGACGRDTVAYWDTTISPAQPMAITTGTNTAIVTNTLRCRPSMTVTKIFVNATGSPIAIQPPPFNLHVTCSPLAIPPTSLSLTPPANAQGVVANVPVGSGETCTVTEPVLPAIPAVAQRICGGTAYWDSSPAFAPSQTIPISTTVPNAVAVTNTLRCKTGSLIVKKTVTSNTSIPLPANTQFPMTVTCGPAPRTTSFSLTAPGSYQVNNIPILDTCTVAETLPALPTNLCPQGVAAVWDPPPTYTPSSVVIGGTPVTITVHNTVRCVDISSYPLTVKKIVSPDPLGIGSTLPFAITLTCTNPLTGSHLITVHGNGSGSINLPFHSVCTIAETQPPLPPNCTWNPPVFSPATVTISGPTNTATVTNSYTCHAIPPKCQPPLVANVDGICVCPPPMVQGPAAGVCICPQNTTLVGGQCVTPPKCQPPLVANADGICGCPPGTVQRGQECVRSIACTPPMVANAAGTACACPPGTVQKGQECVRQITCTPPMVANAAGTACACPPGTVQKGRECVRPINCTPPMVANAAGTACACPPGTVQKGRECVRPIVCNPPARPDPSGTACLCPPGMVLTDRSCTPQRGGPTSPRQPGQR